MDLPPSYDDVVRSSQTAACPEASNAAYPAASNAASSVSTQPAVLSPVAMATPFQVNAGFDASMEPRSMAYVQPQSSSVMTPSSQVGYVTSPGGQQDLGGQMPASHGYAADLARKGGRGGQGGQGAQVVFQASSQPGLATGPNVIVHATPPWICPNDIPDHMTYGIVATFCCVPIGLTAMLKSKECQRARERGDTETALRCSRDAKTFGLFGIGFGSFFFFFITIVMIVLELD